MIVPSIELMGGAAVQLTHRGGDALEIDAGDPHAIAGRLRLAGEIALIDLDAALGQGENRATIEGLLRLAPCRVGGGIRDVEAARRWLDAGAHKVILGTAARPELLRRLPRERVIAALDAVDGELAAEGWRRRTGHGIFERVRELRGVVGGLLITFVEREGPLDREDLDQIEALVHAAGGARVTIARATTTAAEIATLDRLGADTQIGLPLLNGQLELGDAIAAPLQSDRPDGLWPTVICDEQGRALGLAHSNAESLREAVRARRGIYWSRSRQALWVKGARSGAAQELLGVDLDCDRDALRFTVRQEGPGFCHLQTWSCWGDDRGIGRLARRLSEQVQRGPAGALSEPLLGDPALLRADLIEEAAELADARGAAELAQRAAEVIRLTLVAAARGGAPLSAIEAELDRHERRLSGHRRGATDQTAQQSAAVDVTGLGPRDFARGQGRQASGAEGVLPYVEAPRAQVDAEIARNDRSRRGATPDAVAATSKTASQPKEER